MISDIAEDHGSGPAREILDILRAARESHPGIRMVLSGSLGIHHVVAELRAKGGMWVPTHDMRGEDLPPLTAPDATFLAQELLKNEEIECTDFSDVAETIAREVDCIPFLHPSDRLPGLRTLFGEKRLDQVDPDTVRSVVEDATQNALDPWELGHYVARTPVYYGDDVELVNQILDYVAGSEGPQSLNEIQAGLAAKGRPPVRKDPRTSLAALQGLLPR